MFLSSVSAKWMRKQRRADKQLNNVSPLLFSLEKGRRQQNNIFVICETKCRDVPQSRVLVWPWFAFLIISLDVLSQVIYERMRI